MCVCVYIPYIHIYALFYFPLPESVLSCKILDSFSNPPSKDLLPFLIQYSQMTFVGSMSLSPL